MEEIKEVDVILKTLGIACNEYTIIKNYLENNKNLSNTQIHNIICFIIYTKDNNIDYKKIKLESFIKYLANSKSKHLNLKSEQLLITNKYKSEYDTMSMIKDMVEFYIYLKTIKTEVRLGSQLNKYLNLYKKEKEESIKKINSLIDSYLIDNNIVISNDSNYINLLSKQEMQRIYNNCYNNRDKLIIFMLWETSITTKELVNICLSDINLNNRELIIKNESDGEKRKIEISNELANIIKIYISEQKEDEINNDFLFVKFRGESKNEPLEITDINALFTRIKRILNMNILTGNLIRISSISNYYKLNIDDKEIENRTGITIKDLTDFISDENKVSWKKTYIKHMLKTKFLNVHILADVGSIV